jgi:hypothetical protein
VKNIGSFADQKLMRHVGKFKNPIVFQLLAFISGCSTNETAYDINPMYSGQPRGPSRQPSHDKPFFYKECTGTHDPYPGGSSFDCN